MKIVLMLGMVLVLSQATWAVTVPPPGIGAYTFDRARNQDNGTSYVPTTAFNPANYNVPFDPHGVVPTGVDISYPLGRVGTEDNWGIALVYQLSNGQPSGSGTAIIAKPPIYYDNSAGTNDTWLVAIFHNGTDREVILSTPTAGHVSDFSVVTTGTQMELWAVDKSMLGALADPNNLLDFNAASRLSANEYAGWLDATSKSTAVRLFTGTSAYAEFKGGVSDSGKFDGTNNIYFDIDAGSGAWASAIEPGNFFLTPKLNPSDPDHYSDIFLTFTDQASDTWNTYSSDQGGWKVIPEPLTMLGVFMGVGGLTGYIRRRSSLA